MTLLSADQDAEQSLQHFHGSGGIKIGVQGLLRKRVSS